METKEDYGNGDGAVASEQEESGVTQSTAAWLKEGFQSFTRLFNPAPSTATATASPERVAKPQSKQTELETVANSEWYIVDSYQEDDMSSSSSGSLMAEGTSNNLTPTASRKRSQAGSTKGQSSTASVGPRTSSVSGKNPRVTKQVGSSSGGATTTSSPHTSASPRAGSSTSSASTTTATGGSSGRHNNTSAQATTSSTSRPSTGSSSLQTTPSVRGSNTSPVNSRPNSGNTTPNSARHNSSSHGSSASPHTTLNSRPNTTSGARPGNVSPQTTINPRPNSGNATNSSSARGLNSGNASPQTTINSRPSSRNATNSSSARGLNSGNTSLQTTINSRPSSGNATNSGSARGLNSGNASPQLTSSSARGPNSSSSSGRSSPHLNSNPLLATTSSSSSSSSSATSTTSTTSTTTSNASHSPVQRKISSNSSRSRQTNNLEVQNGGGSSHRSVSPARIRSSSPSGRGKTSTSSSSTSKSNSSKRKMVLQEAGISNRTTTTTTNHHHVSGSSSPRLDPPTSGSHDNNTRTTTTTSSSSQSNGSIPQGSVAAAIAGGPTHNRTGSPSQARASSPSRASSLKSNSSSSSSTPNVIKSSMKQRKSILSQDKAPSSPGGGGSGRSTISASQGAVPLSSISNGKVPSENEVIKASDKDKEGDEGESSSFDKVRDTLRISRPKKKKKGKKLAYSIIVDTDQMSTPDISLNGPDKYQDPFETSYAENSEVSKGPKVTHDFKPTSIAHSKQEYCDHCGDEAWGLYRQVLKCSKCNFVAHRKCESRVVIGCTSSRLEQGILQHDKQVEDVERIAAREEVVVEEGKKEKEKQDAVYSGTPSSSSSSGSSGVATPSTSAPPPSRTSSAPVPPVSSAPTSSGYNEASTPNPITSQYISEKAKLSRKIREYNRKTTPVHHIHIKSSHQSVDPASIEYHGFVRVHMNVQRPIHVSTAITRTSWYRLMRPVKERTINDGDGYDIQTAFYLPLDTNRLVNIQNKTTTKELVQILLKKFCVTDNPKKFSLYEEYSGDCRRLFEEDRPLEISLDASVSHRNSKLVLRDNTYSTIQWDAFTSPELSNFIQILQREEELYLDRMKDRFDVWRKCIHQSLKEKCMEEQAKKTKKAVNSRVTPRKSPKFSPKTSLKKNGRVTKS